MRLFKVKYKSWTAGYRSIRHHETLAVGKTAEQAIRLVCDNIGLICPHDFTAEEVNNVFGHKIIVEV